jgi:hydroxymethylglutaryl-CoA reductase
MLIIELHMDVCESMGANAVNTLCEKMAPYFENMLYGRAGLKILSNLCTERRSIAQFEVLLSKMDYKGK